MRDYAKEMEQKILQNIEEHSQRIQEVAETSMWQTLKALQPLAQQKIKDIIREKLANVPPSKYYDRLSSGGIEEAYTVEITQGGGHYVMSLVFTPDKIRSTGVLGQRPKGNKFYSYAYSWGGKNVVGRPLEGMYKAGVVENILEDIDGQNFESIEEAFQDWANTKFGELFEKNFRVQMHRYK